VATTDIKTALQQITREEFFPVVSDLLPEMDPVWSKIKPTTVGVERQGGLGRGWLVRRVYTSGLAGQVEPMDPYADSFTTNAVRYHGKTLRGLTEAYPNVIGTPLKGTLLKTQRLAGRKGNMGFPIELMLSDQLNATMLQYVASNIKACARRVALAKVHDFFAPSNGSLCQVYTTSADGTGTGGAVTFNITSGSGRIQMLQNNMMVDVYSYTSSTTDTWTKLNVDAAGNDVPMLVDAIDYMHPTATNSVRLVSQDARVLGAAITVSAGTPSSPSGPSAVYLFARGAIKGSPAVLSGVTANAAPVTKGPMGYLDFTKAATGSAVYLMAPYGDTSEGINLLEHPEFGSTVIAVSAALTELYLNRVIGGFMENTGLGVDTVVTTLGVTEKYAEQPLLDGGRQVYERTGQVLKFTGGRAKVGFELEGDTFEWVISRYIPNGTVWIPKLNAGNIKSYLPPKLPGSKTQAEFENVIQFTGPALGFPDIWIPVYADDQVQRMVQAPFEMMEQVIPEQTQSILLTSVSEATIPTS
jgi:hypothetical protein